MNKLFISIYIKTYFCFKLRFVFRVVCITDYSDSIKTGPVLISVKNKFSDASDVLFSYVVSNQLP